MSSWLNKEEMQNGNIKMQSAGSPSDFKKQFEDRLKRFSVAVVQLAKQLKTDSLFWTIADQSLRSGTSIGANVIEARAASSLKDFIRFFEYALKSANETVYWLEIVRDTSDSCRESAERLRKEADEIAHILAASICTMKEK